MAEKEPIIVIKKITVTAAGGHGGSWKVAFADFMTAMMAFFLVMWLLSQSEEVKKNVSEHFSTPSVIEYNFSNYGVELTLEKLFLDLVNEPLKTLQNFMKPMDYTPNFMAMGSQKVVLYHMADQLGDVASDVQVHADGMYFEIPARQLFLESSGRTSSQFADIMDKVRGMTAGIEDSNIFIDSLNYASAGGQKAAQNVAEQRLDLVTAKVNAGLEHETVDIYGKAEVLKGTPGTDGLPKEPVIRVRVKQKEFRADGSRQRPLEEAFGKGDTKMNVYDNFVKQLTEGRQSKE